MVVVVDGKEWARAVMLDGDEVLLFMSCAKMWWVGAVRNDGYRKRRACLGEP